MEKKKDVILLTGAGQIGMAIARRIGYGKKIIIGDKKLENANVKSSIQSIYLRDKSLYPIQLAVRNLLEEETALKGDSVMTRYAQLMKYALIVVVSTPIVVLYPFLQKYFEKGVMMGSVKS